MMSGFPKHLRFLLLPYGVLLASTAGVIVGGAWMWSGFATLAVLAVGGDELLPSDPGNPEYAHPLLLQTMLFGTLPLIVLLNVALIWQSIDAGSLPAGAAWLQRQAGWAPRAPAAPVHIAGGVLSTAFMVGIAATNVAHELMHWRSRAAVFFSKVLLVFSFDVPLVISHVYGHHVEVGTSRDHTTARRGESSYAYIWRSTVDGNVNAWRIERQRLRAEGRFALDWRNRFLRGHAGALLASIAAGLLGGWGGAALFLLCAVLAKCILELINYIQHYGIVRERDTPIGIRHAWNSDRVISTWLLFNVTRHSHHHFEPNLPFWQLRSLSDAPSLPRGYLTSIFIALIPPWWHSHMTAALLRWDRGFATPRERDIARRDNRASGVRGLAASA